MVSVSIKCFVELSKHMHAVVSCEHARGGIVRTEHIIENKEGDENNRLEPI